jgi:hypothetical protein
MQILPFVYVVLVAMLSSQAAGLHFYLGGDKQKCFYQDLPQTTVLAARHSAWELEDGTNNWVRSDSLAIQISIEVWDH